MNKPKDLKPTIRELIEKNKLLLKDKFISDASHLISANFLSQVLNVATLAAIAKFYSAYSFGILTLFLVIPSLLLSFSTGRYEQSIQIARTEKEAMSIVFLSVALVFAVSLLTLGGTLVFKTQIAKLVGGPEIIDYLPYTSIFVFFSGLFQVIRVWSLRKNRFKNISRSIMAQTVLGNLIIIFGSFSSFHTFSLILGTFAKQCAAVVPLLLLMRKSDLDTMKEVAVHDVKECAKKYLSLSWSLMIGYSLASASFQVIIMTIGRLWGVEAVGQFQLAYRIALFPCTVIADAISEIFKQRAVELYHKTGEFKDLVIKILKILMLSALVPYVIGIVITPSVLGHFLSDKWIPAISLVQILLVQSYFTLTISPIDKWASIVQNKLYIYMWQSGKILGIILVSLFVKAFGFSLHFYIAGVTLVIIGFYLIDAYCGIRGSSGQGIYNVAA